MHAIFKLINKEWTVLCKSLNILEYLIKSFSWSLNILHDNLQIQEETKAKV